MSKRGYGLAENAGVFYDDETHLKVLPGDTVQLDKQQVGARTAIAIQRGHLIEVNSSAKDTKADDDKENAKDKSKEKAK